MDSTPNTKLKICQWNARGCKNKNVEIRNFLNHYNIDILLLSETLLTEKTKFKIPGYRVYRTDKIVIDEEDEDENKTSTNGTAVIIKNGIKNYEIVINNLESLEASTVNIKANGETLTIISAYRSPNTSFNKNDLDKIFQISPKIFTAGDYHGKNRAWGSRVNNTYGNKLLNYSVETGIEVSAPDQGAVHSAHTSCAPGVRQKMAHS